MKIIAIALAFGFLLTVGFIAHSSVAEARSGCCSHHGGVCGCGCCDGTPLSSTCAPYYPSCSSGSSNNSNSYNYQVQQPQCPSYSTYDGLSGSCKCWSGYKSEGNSCVAITCPSNAELIGSNCYCNIGYHWNNEKTSCLVDDVFLTCADNQVLKNGKCLSYTEDCRLSHGERATGTRGGFNISRCGCEKGYEMKNSKCVKISEIKAKAQINIVIREKANSNAKKIGSMRSGESAIVTDLNNREWVKIKFGKIEGWVMKKYVTIK